MKKTISIEDHNKEKEEIIKNWKEKVIDQERIIDLKDDLLEEKNLSIEFLNECNYDLSRGEAYRNTVIYLLGACNIICILVLIIN